MRPSTTARCMPDRGRDPRGVRRLPVPARLRATLISAVASRCRRPAFWFRIDGVNLNFCRCWRSPWCRRAGRRRDRRIEISRHANGQKRLSASSRRREIGLASCDDHGDRGVSPVALMPVSGRSSKFRLHVVVPYDEFARRANDPPLMAPISSSRRRRGTARQMDERYLALLNGPCRPAR